MPVYRYRALDTEEKLTTGVVEASNPKDARMQLDKEVMTAMRGGNFDEAIAKVDAFIAKHKVEGEEKQELLGMKMNPLLAGKKLEEAAKVIDELIAAAPESRAAKFAESFKPRLQKMIEDEKNKQGEAPKEEPETVE